MYSVVPVRGRVKHWCLLVMGEQGVGFVVWGGVSNEDVA